jgi:hypothetical protein
MSLASKILSSNREAKYSMNPMSSRPNFESENMSFKSHALERKMVPLTGIRAIERSALND